MLGKRYRIPTPPTNILTVAACTAVVFFVLAFGGKVLEGYRLRRHLALLQSEIVQVEAAHQALEAEIAYVESPDYAEKVAREQFKWAKSGETLVVPIYRVGAATGTAGGELGPVLAVDESGVRGRWREWWALLRNPLD